MPSNTPTAVTDLYSEALSYPHPRGTGLCHNAVNIADNIY